MTTDARAPDPPRITHVSAVNLRLGDVLDYADGRKVVALYEGNRVMQVEVEGGRIHYFQKMRSVPVRIPRPRA